MKEWEELEDNFLKEVKPLVDEFIKNKQQMISQEQIRDNSYRIRKIVESKVKTFVNNYREMVNREIKAKETEATQIKEQRIEELKSLIQIRDKIIKINEAKKEVKNGKDEKTYKLLCFSDIEERQKFDKLRQEYNTKLEQYKSNIEEIEELGKILSEFEQKYGDMGYITEFEIYRLDNIIGLKEESTMNRMTEGRVYFKNAGEINNAGDALDIPTKVIQKEREELEAIHRQVVDPLVAEARASINKFADEKIREIMEMDDEENTQGEIEEVEKTIKDDENNNKSGTTSKKEKISLWQRFKSIFRKKDNPRLGEAKKQEAESDNKFMASIRKNAPTQKQQAEYIKNIDEDRKEDIKTENEQDFEEVLSILLDEI